MGSYFSYSGLDITLVISFNSNSISVFWILLFWFYCCEGRSSVPKSPDQDHIVFYKWGLPQIGQFQSPCLNNEGTLTPYV